MPNIDVLAKKLSCRVSEQVSLSPFCTFGVAGKADFFLEPERVEDVQETMRWCRDENLPMFCLGGGSNVLLSDMSGVVVLSRGFGSIRWQNDGNDVIVEVGSGYPLRRLVRESMSRGLSGLEFAIGIPGSVGGAVLGNAGAKGLNFGGLLLWVESVEPDGSLARISSSEIESGYRFSSLSTGLRFLTKCAFRLSKSSAENVRITCIEYWKSRAGQPFSAKSAGCIFKNPPGDFAGRLLDECGCKGMNVGGARVSGLHANFIVNDGSASVADIKALVEKCRAVVKDKKGIILDLEVRVFGAENS